MPERPSIDDSESSAEPPRESLRERLGHVIFETHPGWPQRFDAILLVVILLSVLAVMLESVSSISVRHGRWLIAAEWLFTGLFTIEYGLRLWTADRRLSYALSFFGLIDVLSILPTYLGLFIGGLHSLVILRILRLLRIFRVLKIVRMSREATSLTTALWASSAKIVVFMGSVLLLVTIIGAVMHLIEGAANGFTSIPRSVYWAVVTLTTVGYGDIAPQTAPGQILAAVVMILGYGVIAVPTGIISAELVSIRTVKRECRECHLTDHAHDATFCRGCGAVLDLTPHD